MNGSEKIIATPPPTTVGNALPDVVSQRFQGIVDPEIQEINLRELASELRTIQTNSHPDSDEHQIAQCWLTTIEAFRSGSLGARNTSNTPSWIYFQSNMSNVFSMQDDLSKVHLAEGTTNWPDDSGFSQQLQEEVNAYLCAIYLGENPTIQERIRIIETHVGQGWLVTAHSDPYRPQKVRELMRLRYLELLLLQQQGILPEEMLNQENDMGHLR